MSVRNLTASPIAFDRFSSLSIMCWLRYPDAFPMASAFLSVSSSLTEAHSPGRRQERVRASRKVFFL